MDIEFIIQKAIPIHEKDCISADGKKCERDCRLTVDYKKVQREALRKRLIEYGEFKKQEGREESKKDWTGHLNKQIID